MSFVVVCGLLAGAALAQPDKKIAIVDIPWRTIKAPDKRVWDVCVPQLVMPELVRGIRPLDTDTYLVATMAGEGLLYDLPGRKLHRVPENVMVHGLARKSQVVYWSEFNGEGQALFAYSLATKNKVAIPAPSPDKRALFRQWVEGERLFAYDGPDRRLVWNGTDWLPPTDPQRAPLPEGPLYVVTAPEFDNGVVGGGERYEVLQLGWQQGTPGQVVTTGVQSAFLDSRCENLLFLSQEHLFVCKIRQLSPEEIAAREAAELKQKAIIDAKQSVLALIMYLSDNDDVLPKDFQIGNLNPYAKDSNIFKDFVFTYDGPKDWRKIENPADTAIGYIPGPGGRAVAYADGHVKWISDKK